MKKKNGQVYRLFILHQHRRNFFMSGEGEQKFLGVYFLDFDGPEIVFNDLAALPSFRA